MCDHVSEAVNNSKYSNFYIKLLVLSKNDEEFTLLYGFCVPTKQPTYPWKYRDTEKKRHSIWSAILSQEDATSFAHSLTIPSQITLGRKNFKSPELLKRPVVLSHDGQNNTPGPVSEFCRVTEFWNVNKNALLKKIENAFEADGKELYQHIQKLLTWAHEECGIDFSKDAMRIGNFEIYDLSSSKDAFDVEIHKEFGLKKTTILKKSSFSKDFIVNCTAEHRGRSILNETKLFPIQNQHLDFFADEPMSQVVVQIWEAESGDLIFSKNLTLTMGMSLTLNIGSPPYQIRDPWSNKLFSSAANRSDIIKKQIESVSKSTHAQTITVNSGTHDAIDKAIDDSRTLFSGYRQSRPKGAFIANIQKDGEINSFLKIREYIELPSVKRAIIADPYFSVISAQKLLTRIPRTDIQLDIITSLTDTDPDTNDKMDVCEKYRKFLTNNASILHKNLSIRNLKRGKNPVFHDRYLIRFFDDGRIDGFLLSNSFNSMGQFYPFVIAPMEQEICYEVCNYLENMCDSEFQSKLPVKDCIVSELLCDFHSEYKLKTAIKPEHLPFDLWLTPWCSNGSMPNIPKEELVSVVNTLWEHWEDEKLLTCKMFGFLALTTHPWCAKDLASAMKSIENAENDFIKEFAKNATAIEQQQNHISNGLNSDVYVRSALLNGHAKPSRQGFSKLFDEAGHVWYARENWLKGGYALLLQLSPSTFTEMLDDIKSPLMFDVLATQMLFYPWDEMLFNATVKSKNLCIKLLCGEYVFHQLQKNRLTIIQIEEVIIKLSPEASSLQLSYLLSQLVFHVRATHSIKLEEDEIHTIYAWMLKKLATDLSQCNEETQSLALHWLYDCEICSNCKLHLDLASLVADYEIKVKLYKEVITDAERDLITTSYSRDVTKLVNLYLQAMDALWGNAAEQKLLKNIIDWRAFETATEPALKYYNYSKWSSANVRAQWQMHILNEHVSRHPLSKDAKDWLEYWEPRMRAID